MLKKKEKEKKRQCVASAYCISASVSNLKQYCRHLLAMKYNLLCNSENKEPDVSVVLMFSTSLTPVYY